jgi:hypothetical protein
LFAQSAAPDLAAIGDLREYLKPTWISESFGDPGEAFVIERHRAYR